MRARLTLALALLFLSVSAGTSTAVEVTLFGPHQYLRTTSHPNIYSGTFGAVVGQGRLIVRNGDENGTHRVSSAQIVINGTQILGPNNFNQQIYQIEARLDLAEQNSVSVTLGSGPEGHITVQVVMDSTPDATTVQVIGIEGGTLSVTNHLGDVMTLTVPPLALAEPTSISAAALSALLPNPIDKRVWPGVLLEPSGLQFSLPVTITVTFHTPLAKPAAAALYWLVDSAHALPLANQAVSQNEITGEIDHFTEVFAGEATDDEWTSIAEAIASNTEGTPSALLDDVKALLTYARYLESLDNAEKAAEVRAAATQMLLEGSTALLSQPVPADACGFYTRRLQQLSELITTLSGDTSLANAVKSKGCSFDVTPQLLNLNPGEIWAQGFTAVLRDPAGTDRSCSVLRWYSADVDVVAITSATGNSAVPKAAGKAGTAHISANCDGLIASAEVAVVSEVYEGEAILSGTFCLSGVGTGCSDCWWNWSQAWPLRATVTQAAGGGSTSWLSSTGTGTELITVARIDLTRCASSPERSACEAGIIATCNSRAYSGPPRYPTSISCTPPGSAVWVSCSGAVSGDTWAGTASIWLSHAPFVEQAITGLISLPRVRW